MLTQIPVYLLKVLLCSAVLFTYYWYVLQNNKFHQYNRFYLLGITIFSWLTPLLKINAVDFQHTESNRIVPFMYDVAVVNNDIENTLVQSGSLDDVNYILATIFILVTFLLLVKFIASIWKIYRLIRNAELQHTGNLTIIFTNIKGTPFSFFNYIFWDSSIELNSNAGKMILAHEVIHAKEKHSIDKVLLEANMIIGWFNPFFWLIKKELFLIHEFIADTKSIQSEDPAELAELLLISTFPEQQYIFTNSFFYSPIKRRIFMFTKNQTTRFIYFKKLSVLPISFLLLLLLSLSSSKVNAINIVSQSSNQVLKNKGTESSSSTDTTPKSTLMFLKKADKNNAQNEAVSSGNNRIDVTKDKVTIKTSSAEVAKKALENADNITITKSKKDGAEQFVIEKETSAEHQLPNNLLYILDGKKITEQEMKSITPDQIARVYVLKGEKAVQQYGNDGKNGVVEIISKTKQ